MKFDNVVIMVISIGVLLGGIDRIIGNKFGLGEKFEEGFNIMGPLALGMVGIVSLAPVIAEGLGPFIIPAFKAIGADPAMFGSILANDMGGYPLAVSLAESKEAAILSGLIISSMLGCTLVFSIPLGFGLIEINDREYFAKGLLIGMMTIPIGGIVGGLSAGFNLKFVIINNIPIMIISALLSLGIKVMPERMIKGAVLFGKITGVVITAGLIAAAIEHLTGIVLIRGMAPITEGLSSVANIGVVLLGTFPIVSIILRVLNRPLKVFGGKLGMNSAGAAGIVVSMANSVPVFNMIKDMDERGKVVNVAWIVSGSSIFGAHLGFTAGINQEMITPVILAKASAGITAIILALLMTKDAS